MKKLVFLISFVIILVAFYLSINSYILDSTDKLTDLSPGENQKDANTSQSDQNVKEITKNPVDQKSVAESEPSIHHEGTDLVQEMKDKSNDEFADQESLKDVLKNEHSLQENPWQETIDAILEA